MAPLGSSWGVWTVVGAVDRVVEAPGERTVEETDVAGRGKRWQSGGPGSGNTGESFR